MRARLREIQHNDLMLTEFGSDPEKVNKVAEKNNYSHGWQGV